MNLRQSLTLLKTAKAARLVEQHHNTVVFVSSLLRARELKIATALRSVGWKVVLVYKQTTPFQPGDYFDAAIRAVDDADMHAITKVLQPRVCHVFSGAVDEALLRLCRDKPGPLVIDLNDVFCPSLFNYLQERFEPTRECLALADALCARDLQPKFAERFDGFKLPRDMILFPEYSWRDGPTDAAAVKRHEPDEVRVVSVGTFCLETQGMYDSCYLQLARMLAEQKIHLHIYPHWFYLKERGNAFNFNLKNDFMDFFALQGQTPYVHVHESLPLDALARELPQYDFGIVSGGAKAFGQKLGFLTENYMQACYSGRISDYIDARLPVLINREVGFNYWLLHRYGIGVDLGGLLQPGFRDKLLEIKHDRAQAASTARTAQTLSLGAHAQRLARFYERIAAEANKETIRIPVWSRVASRLPIAGSRLRRFIQSVEAANQNARRSAQAEGDLSRREQQLRRLLDMVKTEDMARQKAADLLIAEERVNTLSKERLGLQERVAKLEAHVMSLRQEIKISSMQVDEVAGLLNWPEISEDVERQNGFDELQRLWCLAALSAIPNAKSNGSISSAWHVLNHKNLDQLLQHGYHNFKRTIGLNYFNFPIQANDPQIAAAEAVLNRQDIDRCWKLANELPDDRDFALTSQLHYRYLVLLLWTYVSKNDKAGCLGRLKEPMEGNPVIVPIDGHSASQDLANSILEYYAMSEAVVFDQCKRVLEIGGGYGRDAFVVMRMHPQVQYTVVDIPPALYLAQRYLSSTFKDRKIFRPREFDDYNQVKEEMDAAGVIFLLPHQLQKLPADHFGLTLSISSFGEMTVEQNSYYFAQIDRVTRGHFYTKQWKQSKNPFDGLLLTQQNYPVMPRWRRIYSRDCVVQSEFFEALYEIKGSR